MTRSIRLLPLAALLAASTALTACNTIDRLQSVGAEPKLSKIENPSAGQPPVTNLIKERVGRSLTLVVMAQLFAATYPDRFTGHIRVVLTNSDNSGAIGFASALWTDSLGVGPHWTTQVLGDDLFYESPPGVVDEPDERLTGLEGGRTQVNERSLRLLATNLAPWERAEAYVRFPEGDKSFLGYRRLRLWARGRGAGWGTDGALHFYVKVGRDADLRHAPEDRRATRHAHQRRLVHRRDDADEFAEVDLLGELRDLVDVEFAGKRHELAHLVEIHVGIGGWRLEVQGRSVKDSPERLSGLSQIPPCPEREGRSCSKSNGP